MEIIKVNGNNEEQIIDLACSTLKKGGIIIYPTETNYGIGVDASNEEAVKKLLKYKQKRESKAISIIVSDLEMAKKWVEINDTALSIYKNLLPGPITVISNGRHKLAPFVEAENGSQGVRIPNYKLILHISKKYQFPFTATSANASGKKTPYCIDDILSNISKKQLNLIDLIIDAGELPHNRPSTVVDTILNDYQIVRSGAITFANESSIVTNSADESISFGITMTNQYRPFLNDHYLIFALQGELGTGKTQFTKGVAKALDINEIIISPTFTISREYPFENGILVHIDAYRLENEHEINNIGFNEFMKNGNIIVIEWVDRILPFLKNLEKEPSCKIIWIKIEHLDINTRKIFYDKK